MSFCVLKSIGHRFFTTPGVFFVFDVSLAVRVSALPHQSPIRIKDAASAWSGRSSRFAIRRADNLQCHISTMIRTWVRKGGSDSHKKKFIKYAKPLLEEIQPPTRH